MPQIDIELPADVLAALQIPRCVDLKLPAPLPLSIALPTGSISAVADFTKGIPDDCALSLSLLLQLGPFLANFECLFRAIGVVAPLVNIVLGLVKNPFSPPIGEVQKIGEALPPFLECVAKLALPPLDFVRDVLVLIAKLLRCIIRQLRSIAAILSGFALKIAAARAAGNAELLAALECARDNAQIAGAHVMAALNPITLVLALMAPFLALAGVQAIALPTVGSPESADAILQIVATLEPPTIIIETAARALGGQV